MALNSSPAIACIGIIGKYASQRIVPHPECTDALCQDNPLHISLFAPHEHEMLEMSFLLNSCLDIFDIRQAKKTVDQDLGLLQAIDERLATYGWLTNTGVKFIIVVDMSGRPPPPEEDRRKIAPIVGLRDADLKPAFNAIQTAYIRLLLNPFYTPDDRTPLQLANSAGRAAQITSKRFIHELQRIGKMWYPAISSI
jgi:trafficking protein particle complex subunit 2